MRLRLLPDALLLLVPATIVLQLAHASGALVFICAALAMVPLAGWLGKGTEQLASRTSEGIGGLLNATFGNAAELIIAIAGIRHGLLSVVKASLTGSIIGNVLLVLGMCMLCGGWKRERQRFNAMAASAGASALTLSAISLLVPAVYALLMRSQNEPHLMQVSVTISGVMLVTYACSLIFSLRTHKHLYLGELPEEAVAGADGAWPIARSMAVMLVATVLVAWMSELLVDAVEPATRSLGLSETFLGIVVFAIIGNAAEHSTAVSMALQDRMDLAMGIAVGSSIQIALFVAPILVILSQATAHPMNLVFTPAEVMAVAVAAIIMGQISQDGESNWWEGVQLLSVYLILALVFYYLR
ncbi:MAG: calcium/proton exchanger [Candidatus Xenobia bacterium]